MDKKVNDIKKQEKYFLNTDVICLNDAVNK